MTLHVQKGAEMTTLLKLSATTVKMIPAAEALCNMLTDWVSEDEIRRKPTLPGENEHPPLCLTSESLLITQELADRKLKAKNVLNPFGSDAIMKCRYIFELGMAVDEGWIYPPPKRIARIETVARLLGDIKEDLEEKDETDDLKWIIRYPASSIRRELTQGIKLLRTTYEL